ncbi:MAG: hypothetical protein HWN66_05570 [Candidatus Helarchaeota archaeon]|nr:hypothetical protein [Candidatus Helarchaeota archaeon]
MATYKEIQLYVLKKYGFVLRICWIAHAKDICGLPLRKAPNRIYSNKKMDPCPEDKFPALKEAFKHFVVN